MLNRTSLQSHSKLKGEEYFEMMKLCGFFYGSKKGFNEPAFKSFLISKHINGEIIKAQPKGSEGKRHFIRLGIKEDGYHLNPCTQTRSELFDPPLFNGIGTARKKLRNAMKQISNPSNADSGDESHASSDENGDEERESQDDDTEFVSTENKLNNSYPLTSSLGIDVIELSDSQIQQLIGELVNLQQSRTALNSKTSFEFTHG